LLDRHYKFIYIHIVCKVHLPINGTLVLVPADAEDPLELVAVEPPLPLPTNLNGDSPILYHQ
jgi:hypothetical protein